MADVYCTGCKDTWSGDMYCGRCIREKDRKIKYLKSEVAELKESQRILLDEITELKRKIEELQ